jgi:hypothetical protein
VSGAPADTAREARRLLAPVRADVLELLRALVRTDTVAVPPAGAEAAGQRVLASFLCRRGLGAEVYDTGFLERSRHPLARRGRNYRGRPNLIARIPGRGGGRSLLLSGHMDTVPPGLRPWRHGAFSATQAGGRLYGRGAWDMKGGLAAQFVPPKKDPPEIKTPIGQFVGSRGDATCAPLAGGGGGIWLHPDDADGASLLRTGLRSATIRRGGGPGRAFRARDPGSRASPSG